MRFVWKIPEPIEFSLEI